MKVNRTFHFLFYIYQLQYTVKKVSDLPTSPWAGIIKLFPPRQSLVSDIPAGDGNVAYLFYGVVSVFIVEAKHVMLICF